MVCRKVPIFETVTATESPGTNGRHVSSGPVQPTPDGVPVMITAPRRKVVPCDKKEMMKATCILVIHALSGWGHDAH